MTWRSTQVRNDEVMETLTYSVFYEDAVGDLHSTKVIANDHEDALKQVMNRGDCKDVRLIFKGETDEPIWMG